MIDKIKQFLYWAGLVFLCLLASALLLANPPSISSPTIKTSLGSKEEEPSLGMICPPSLSTVTFDESDTSFCVDVVSTLAEITKGLMFVESMPNYYGMLFDFGQEQQINMWMKNTYIPLDMAFMDNEGCLLDVVKNTTPISEEVIPSPKNTRYVLEVNTTKFPKIRSKSSKICLDISEPKFQFRKTQIIPEG